MTVGRVGAGGAAARRVLLRADDGRGPLADITDPERPSPVDMADLPLDEALRGRLVGWAGTPIAGRDMVWVVTGGALAAALENALPDTEVHYARGADDPHAPGPVRPPGGGRTDVMTPPGDPRVAYGSTLTITFGAPPPEPPTVLATDADDDDLAELRRRVVEPVARSLLTDQEYRSCRLYRTSREPDVVRVDVGAVGDAFTGGWLASCSPGGTWPGTMGTPVERMAEKLASDLEDWIAESRFGWGQQRHAVYEIPPPRA